MWKVPPARLLMIFYFVSAFAVVYPIVYRPSIVNFIIYFGYLYYLVIKCKGYELFKDYRHIINHSEDVSEFIARTEDFMDARYYKFKNVLSYSYGWILIQCIFMFFRA